AHIGRIDRDEILPGPGERIGELQARRRHGAPTRKQSRWQRVHSWNWDDENRAANKGQRLMMQPVMQIGLLVFMARTMDAKKTQIKPEKWGRRRHAVPTERRPWSSLKMVVTRAPSGDAEARSRAPDVERVTLRAPPLLASRSCYVRIHQAVI